MKKLFNLLTLAVLLLFGCDNTTDGGNTGGGSGNTGGSYTITRGSGVSAIGLDLNETDLEIKEGETSLLIGTGSGTSTTPTLTLSATLNGSRRVVVTLDSNVTVDTESTDKIILKNETDTNGAMEIDFTVSGNVAITGVTYEDLVDFKIDPNESANTSHTDFSIDEDNTLYLLSGQNYTLYLDDFDGNFGTLANLGGSAPHQLADNDKIKWTSLNSGGTPANISTVDGTKIYDSGDAGTQRLEFDITATGKYIIRCELFNADDSVKSDQDGNPYQKDINVTIETSVGAISDNLESSDMVGGAGTLTVGNGSALPVIAPKATEYLFFYKITTSIGSDPTSFFDPTGEPWRNLIDVDQWTNTTDGNWVKADTTDIDFTAGSLTIGSAESPLNARSYTVAVVAKNGVSAELSNRIPMAVNMVVPDFPANMIDASAENVPGGFKVTGAVSIPNGGTLADVGYFFKTENTVTPNTPPNGPGTIINWTNNNWDQYIEGTYPDPNSDAHEYHAGLKGSYDVYYATESEWGISGAFKVETITVDNAAPRVYIDDFGLGDPPTLANQKVKYIEKVGDLGHYEIDNSTGKLILTALFYDPNKDPMHSNGYSWIGSVGTTPVTIDEDSSDPNKAEINLGTVNSTGELSIKVKADDSYGKTSEDATLADIGYKITLVNGSAFSPTPTINVEGSGISYALTNDSGDTFLNIPVIDSGEVTKVLRMSLDDAAFPTDTSGGQTLDPDYTVEIYTSETEYFKADEGTVTISNADSTTGSYTITLTGVKGELYDENGPKTLDNDFPMTVGDGSTTTEITVIQSPSFDTLQRLAIETISTVSPHYFTSATGDPTGWAWNGTSKYIHSNNGARITAAGPDGTPSDRNDDTLTLDVAVVTSPDLTTATVNLVVGWDSTNSVPVPSYPIELTVDDWSRKSSTDQDDTLTYNGVEMPLF